jgi:hypothetical protein
MNLMLKEYNNSNHCCLLIHLTHAGGHILQSIFRNAIIIDIEQS